MTLGHYKQSISSAWRVVRGRYLPVLSVVLMLLSIAGPAAAATDDSDRIVISGAISRDLLIEQLQSRGLVPPSDSGLTLKDYLYSNAGQTRLDAIVGVWLDADGQMVPTSEWKDTHKDHCKNRARSTLEATQLLRFKMHRTKEVSDGRVRYQYSVAAGLLDAPGTYLPEHFHPRRQHIGESTIMQADNSKTGVVNNPDHAALLAPMTEAWDGLNPTVGAPMSPCGDILVTHVSGDAVGEPIEFLAGYKGYYGRSLKYAWDFGDGSKSEDGGKNPSHVYAKKGKYKVSVRVEGKNIEPGSKSISVVIGGDLTLSFVSRMEVHAQANSHFVEKFEALVPLRKGAGSNLEGSAALRNVEMSYSLASQLRDMGCTLTPRHGALDVRAVLPAQETGGTRGIEVFLTIPYDHALATQEAVPGTTLDCPFMQGGPYQAMMRKALAGVGAVWWTGFIALHENAVQADESFRFDDWETSSDPGVIARKVYRGSRTQEGSMTFTEVTTIEIRSATAD